MFFHQRQLDIRVRVCGRRRDARRTCELVSNVIDALLTGFDARQDSPSRHRTRLCSACWKYLERSKTAERELRRSPQTSLGAVPNWPVCEDDSCELGREWQFLTGRPRKRKYKTGRPPKSEQQSLPNPTDKEQLATHSNTAPSSAVFPTLQAS